MLHIYYTRIGSQTIDDLLKEFGPVISVKRKEKINQYKFEEDKKRSLFAELLLFYGLTKDFKIKKYQISETENGKPFLLGINDVYFNISHSQEYVVCAINNSELGIDIEKHDMFLPEVLPFFHKEEKKVIEGVPKKDRQLLFYNYWSLKESYVKYKGEGLFLPMDSFQIEKCEDYYTIVSSDNQSNNEILKLVSIDPNYSCAICHERKKSIQVENISHGMFKRRMLI